MKKPNVTNLETWILRAQADVRSARRELERALSDAETAPILAAKVDTLATAEGELQAFEDAWELTHHFEPTEALLRLSLSSCDPLLVHDVRRAGYARAVSHFFRGTG